MESRKQTLLFEQESLTPTKRAEALKNLFCSVACRHREDPHSGYVPVDVLVAHGDLDSHLRHLVAAATLSKKDRLSQRLLRRIERRLDSLPESIMQTLPATTEQDWMRCYRDLIELDELLDEAQLVEDAQEYATILTKMTRVAETVSEASAVQIRASSIFALWLQKKHTDRYSSRRRRSSHTKKKKSSSGNRKISPSSHAKNTGKAPKSPAQL